MYLKCAVLFIANFFRILNLFFKTIHATQQKEVQLQNANFPLQAVFLKVCFHSERKMEYFLFLLLIFLLCLALKRGKK